MVNFILRTPVRERDYLHLFLTEIVHSVRIPTSDLISKELQQLSKKDKLRGVFSKKKRGEPPNYVTKTVFTFQTIDLHRVVSMGILKRLDDCTMFTTFSCLSDKSE